MRTRTIAIAAAAAAFAVSASAYAAPSMRMSREERALAEAREDVTAQASMTKGAAQQSFELERRRLDDLISDLEAGRRVPAWEIDRALDEARTAP
ncbi:MAG TPA: hypothetical protein VFD92_04295 [Candidatus Binatia bacterium]|nr:hypothetical protein [Candidatus Binatia bacterium]